MKVMGQTGQAIAQRSFTVQAMAKSYDSLYRTLLSKKSSYFTSLLPR
jgi:hypothetical protein